jgi:hypothetical protein
METDKRFWQVFLNNISVFGADAMHFLQPPTRSDIPAIAPRAES